MRVIPYVETRRSYVAPWARRSALLSASVLIVSVAAHWFGALDTPAFFISMGLSAAFALLALMLCAIGMPNVWYRGFRGGRDLAVAIGCAGLVLLPFLAAGAWALTHAPLTDISTDLDDPPAFDQLLKERTTEMNPLSAGDDDWKIEQQAAYPTVAGRRYEVPIENVREVAERVFEARGWPIMGPYLVGTPDVFSLETTVPSPVLALPSDVVVRLVAEGDATLVDMRAASRYGPVDFGLNADLVAGFLSDLDVAMAIRTPAVQSPQPSE